MRSIWKGVVSFGLVSISVRLYTATEERDVAFRQVRQADGSRIRYKRVAEVDGEEVEYADIAKGFELPDGDMVVLTDEDFAALPLATTHTVDVHEFVPLEQIDPIYFAKAYYLEPDKSAVKPYVLLRQALVDSGMVAIVKVAIRSREQLALLRVRDDVLVLETMSWPDEVREASFPFLKEDVEIRPQELQMANSLISSMSTDFDPARYTDNYREALQLVIDAKVSGNRIKKQSGAEAADSKVVDLMSALRASVAAAKTQQHAKPAAAETVLADPDTGDTPVRARKQTARKKAPRKSA